MSRVIAIEPKRSISAARSVAGMLGLSGSVGAEVHINPVNIVGFTRTGEVTPVGALSMATSGPSLVTVPQILGGFVDPVGTVATATVSTPPVDPSTVDAVGSIAPTGAVVGVASGPSFITLLKSIAGGIGLGGDLAKLITPESITLLKSLGSGLGLSGTVDGVAGGPSLVTVPKSVAGSITPAATLATDTFVPPGTVETQAVDGTITPAGDVVGVAGGPSIVTVPASVAGTITPAGAFDKVANTVVILKSIAGSITPAGARSGSVSGPSLVTIPRLLTGAIGPAGARSAIVIPPPVTFFSQAVTGVLTPSGSLASVVSGPSFVTKLKSLQGVLVPSSSLARVTSGPSLVTIPKVVQGTLTPVGTVARQVTNNPQIIPASRSGTITPVGSVTTLVGAGTPIAANPMYASMGGWDTSEFDLHPAWSGLTFSNLPGNTTQCKAQLDAMRARGMKGGLAFPSKGSFCDTDANGNLIFNMTKWQALIQRVKAIPGLQSYIDDGTFTHLCIGDELYHPKMAGSCPPNTRKQMAQYAKAQLPGIKIGLRHHAEHLTGSHLPTGGWAGSLDYGMSFYIGPFRSESRGKTAAQYFADQRALLLSVGIPEMMGGHNWWNGGDGSSGLEGPQTEVAGGSGTFWVASPQEIRATADAALALPYIKFYTLWIDAHDSNLTGAAQMLVYQNRQDFKDAFAYVKSAGLARGGSTPPKQFFTNPGFFTAPNPPPTIALGKGVRDALTDHKVFRLVDGARTIAAEYSALNSDNSLIYYIKGSSGYVADLFWRTQFSEVQITNERIAHGIGPAPVIENWIWDRSNARYAYFMELNNTKIQRRDFRLNTTILIKDLVQDQRFVTYWAARGVNSLTLNDLHANRTQELFCGIVRNTAQSGVGAFVFNRFTSALWNYQAPAGKTVSKVQLDDPGLYLVVRFTDGTWQTAKLDSPTGLSTLSAVQSGAPTDYDIGNLAGGQQAFEGSGIGLRTWDIDPLATTAGIRYSHPQRSGKTNLYNKGKLSLQAFNDLAVYMTYLEAALAQAWTVHSGAIYMIDWNAEQIANTYKLDPEVVRYGSFQMPKVPYTTTPGSGGGPSIVAGPRTVAAIARPTGTVVEISPGTSIQSVVNANVAGTTYIIKAGTHRMQSIVPKTGDRFWGEPGAILNGSRLLSGWTFSSGRWSVGGQTQQGTSTGSCMPGFLCNLPEDLLFNGVHKKRVGTLGEVTAATWFFDYATDTVYVGEDPTGKVVEVGVTNNAFSGSAQNVTIQNLLIERYASNGQTGVIHPSITGTGWKVQSCEIKQCHSTGIVVAPGMLVSGCNVHHNGLQGISGPGGGFGQYTGIIVEDSRFNDNNNSVWAGNEWGFSGGGSKFVFTSGLVVRFCEFSRNLGPGFWADVDNSNALVHNCLCEDNDGAGIFYEISYRLTAHSNICRRNGLTQSRPESGGAGILISASPDCELYNNLLEDNKHGIFAMQQNRGTGPLGTHLVSNLYVHDNFTKLRAGEQTGIVDDTGDPAVFTTRNNRWQANRYWLTDSLIAAHFGWQNAARSFSQWQGFGMDTTGATSTSGYPGGGTVPITVLAAGQWSYDSVSKKLFIRLPNDSNPNGQRIGIFDWRFGMEEIIMVNVGGSLVGRLCRHFSYASIDANAYRGPLMSYDGSRVVFGTTWGNSAIGIYCVLTDPNA